MRWSSLWPRVGLPALPAGRGRVRPALTAGPVEPTPSERVSGTEARGDTPERRQRRRLRAVQVALPECNGAARENGATTGRTPGGRPSRAAGRAAWHCRSATALLVSTAIAR